jgi:hypothetical protein
VDTSAVQTFTITVTPVNDNPVAAADTITRLGAQSTKVLISTLTSNDSDVDNNPLDITAVSAALPAGAVVSVSAPWVFYTPPAGSSAAGSFTYTLSDGAGGTATGNVTVNVTVDDTQSKNTTKIETLPDGSRKVSFAGIPGVSYRVQSTESLSEPITWTTRATISADLVGAFQFTDPPPLPATRFYRSISP